ncbi:hypothetical protein ROHU_012756 [Labeo rohita]|uniref:Uncharacterized protein n=1 Tax=Labeo rohita TaxID=84645 RepID=A0A498LAA5_LABRO|nr:hypothetical protein ROHU_012756 [Labeo rohita]
MMRFYLTTKKVEREEGTESEVEMPDTMEDVHSNNQDQSPTTSSSRMNDFIQASDTDVIFVESVGNDAVSPLQSTEDLNVADDYLNVPFQSSSMTLLDYSDTSDVVTVFTDDITGIDEQNLDDTLPLSPEPIVPHKKILVVHRGQIFSELIAHFCDETLAHTRNEVEVKLLLPNGQYEMGHDVGGVFRDCLSEFWQEFYDQCTLGNNFKVPFLRHDFGKEKWESVARIILFGWKKEKYLPIKLAPAILQQAIQGSVKSDLIDNFLKYVSENERAVLESCRTDFCSADQEELLEILDNYSCRRIPTEENFKQILQELAHKTLIQEPAYVLEQWAGILGPLSKDLEEMEDVYCALQPTDYLCYVVLHFIEHNEVEVAPSKWLEWVNEIVMIWQDYGHEKLKKPHMLKTLMGMGGEKSFLQYDLEFLLLQHFNQTLTSLVPFKILYLCLLSGGSLGNSIRRMLSKIGENSLWAKYSYKGRKGKRPFQHLLINDVIIRACSKVYPQQKSQQVEEMIAVTLKHAPHREKAKTNAQIPNIRVEAEADLEN